MKLIFHVTNGLEDVAVQELEAADVQIEIQDTKAITGNYSNNLQDLKKLTIPDDISISVHQQKLTSNEISQESLNVMSTIDLSSYVETIKNIRNLNNTFSLTVSKYKAKVDVEEFKQELGYQLSQELNMQYTPKSHENFDIRIHIDQQYLTVSIRLFTKPLYQREYIAQDYRGALKPTIAAAMCFMVRSVSPENSKMLDPFCGSGTILCEAYNQGFNISGSDEKSKAVTITKEHLANVGLKKSQTKQSSAFKTSWRDNEFDTVITNPPWDEQLSVKSITELYSKSLEELQRILKLNASLCFIAKKSDLLIKYIKLYFPDHTIETKRISFKGQQPTIVLAYLK